ncbi:hypothetical protein [Comamonas flocculans]|uniref:Uncharacterized protein n=1 Tax=Comamonas flocculans TaxID=2597701 RepID=A0A5B8RXK6_9BURK|nr:hypothetical protein [Comamonas flocculans]QEA12975.1 hypothetical protein FOZ74_08005 [Comamonas flocculans]
MRERPRHPVGRWLMSALLASAAALSACGGGGDATDPSLPPSPPSAGTFKLDTELSGLRADRSLSLRITLDGQAAPVERTLTENGLSTLHAGPAGGFGLHWSACPTARTAPSVPPAARWLPARRRCR